MRYVLYVTFILSLFAAPAYFIFRGPDKVVSNGNIVLTSSAFKDNQKIPTIYTCDGQNFNPPLTISHVPTNAQSLVIVVTDKDAEDWVHWLVWDINPNQFQIEADSPLTDFRVGQNSWQKAEYNGPCPPSGSHRYTFKVYALDKMIGLLKSPDIGLINQQMNGHIIDQGQLIGLYK